mmetsp:Transcript_31921/g.56305  ORF Transcript_31921/g.56305 Transcript_31921/m.56305 type:complete len:238 (-) Transcript_31921:1042-1755(-)
MRPRANSCIGIDVGVAVIAEGAVLCSVPCVARAVLLAARAAVGAMVIGRLGDASMLPLAVPPGVWLVLRRSNSETRARTAQGGLSFPPGPEGVDTSQCTRPFPRGEAHVDADLHGGTVTACIAPEGCAETPRGEGLGRGGTETSLALGSWWAAGYCGGGGPDVIDAEAPCPGPVAPACAAEVIPEAHVAWPCPGSGPECVKRRRCTPESAMRLVELRLAESSRALAQTPAVALAGSA